MRKYVLHYWEMLADGQELIQTYVSEHPAHVPGLNTYVRIRDVRARGGHAESLAGRVVEVVTEEYEHHTYVSVFVDQRVK